MSPKSKGCKWIIFCRRILPDFHLGLERTAYRLYHTKLSLLKDIFPYNGVHLLPIVCVLFQKSSRIHGIKRNYLTDGIKRVIFNTRKQLSENSYRCTMVFERYQLILGYGWSVTSVVFVGVYMLYTQTWTVVNLILVDKRRSGTPFTDMRNFSPSVDK